MSRIPGDCYAAGALALILRVSRLLGMAPIKMTRESGRWRVSTSKAACFYCYIVVFGLRLVYDFSLEHNAVRTRTLTGQIVWTMEVVIVLSITTIGLVEAPTRVKEIIECLNVIEKVYIKSINIDWLNVPGEKKRYIGIILYFLFVLSLHVGQFVGYFIKRRNVNVICLYSSFYIEFFIIVVLEMQFFFIAMHANFALKFINDSLYGLICILDLKSMPKSCFNPNVYTSVPTAPVYILLENLKTKVTMKQDASTLTIKKAQEKVQSLMLSFGAICDVMRKIGASYEKILLLLTASFFFHLVVTPPHLVGYFEASRECARFDTLIPGIKILNRDSLSLLGAPIFPEEIFHMILHLNN
ncbi:7tm chemosensory receptor domain-containing protein [Phthorimaea operculella]|nr:7tm chemosensory receptor domain-containing protein [Phthorimaea operculella]